MKWGSYILGSSTKGSFYLHIHQEITAYEFLLSLLVSRSQISGNLFQLDLVRYFTDSCTIALF
uniref:Uncharacterized protein n=1 Tax=Arundo donax TaxID=35708 RepID=A0A0A9H2V8_ARUDO